MIYTVEVLVAVARPPTAAHTKTVWVLVAIDADYPTYDTDHEARLIATQIADTTRPGVVVMPIAARIVDLVC